MTTPAKIYPNISPNVPCWFSYADPMSASFGVGQSSITEYWDCEFNQLPQFIEDVLGTATSNGAGSGISRALPAQHSLFDYMWCARVSSLRGVGEEPGQSGGPAGFWGDWKIMRCGLVFETPPYAIVPDGETKFEYQRFVVPDQTPESEFFQQRSGSYSIVPAAGLLNNSSIVGSGGIKIRYCKQKLKLTWMLVPDDGLFAGGFPGPSTNIETCVMTVNSKTFMDYAPGTLLLEGWKPMPQTYPSPPVQGGVARAWNVELYFSYFDPQPVLNGNQRGHNCVPVPGQNLWAYAYLTNSDSTNPTNFLYQSTDFNNIFLMN